MKLTTQTFMLPVTLIYCIVLCLFGCAADEELSQELSDDETLTLGDRERILAKALDWNNLQVRGPENEELVYEPNQETPYTGWVVRRWGKRPLIHRPEHEWYNWEVAAPGEEWGYEEIFQVRNGKIDGVYTSWYQNGQKTTEGTFKDGYPDGMWTDWYQNGQKQSESTYNGSIPEDLEPPYIKGYFSPLWWSASWRVAHGMWTEWYSNGQKWWEGEYKDGHAEGMWTYWHENGQKQAEGTFKDGHPEGMWTFWTEDGEVKEEGWW